MAAAMDVDRAGGGERRPSEKELFRAAESGDAAAFASLAPADLSLRNEDGRSLLHVAAAAGHPQVVLALAQCGGDAAANVLNAKDEEGWAPIHSAASSGNSQIIDILLERGTSTILARYVWAANCTISAKDF